MSKRLFEVLDEMNQNDIKNNSRKLAIGNTLIGAEKVKQGGKITIGVDEQSVMEVIDGKSVAILVVVDYEEYNRLTKA